MPSWLSVLVPLIIAVITVTVNAVVNIKIKFAPDAQTAFRDLKDTALRVFQWILNAVLVFQLLRQVFSSEPLTRVAVFAIALHVAVLMLIVVLHMFSRIISVLEQLVHSRGRAVGIITGTKDALRSEKKSGR
jgi:hypothetical protein